MAFLYTLEALRTPFWDAVFQFFTLFGEETTYLVVAMVFFWCINKRWGYYLLYIGMLGTFVNQFLKLVFCVPRPWVQDPGFSIVESARASATGYSFPSGHTQNAGGLYLGIGRAVRNRYVRIATVLLTLLVAFSRMYLGVHTPADVLVGLGTAVLLVMLTSPAFYRGWDVDRRWLYLLMGVLLLAGAALIAYVECAPLPPNADPAVSAAGRKVCYTMMGGSLGIALSMWLDTRYIRFSEKAVWWAQILKTALGFGLIMAVRVLLKAPLSVLFGGHYAADGVRYFLMMVVGGTLWPLTFPLFARLGNRPDSEA